MLDQSALAACSTCLAACQQFIPRHRPCREYCLDPHAAACLLAQLIEDLAEEAGKYGALQGVAAPLPPPTATALEPARVYLRYAQVSEATAAKEVFHGRTFDDNAISARFSSEMAFVQVHCTGCLEAFRRHSARLSRPGPPSCVTRVPPACSLGTYRRLLIPTAEMLTSACAWSQAEAGVWDADAALGLAPGLAPTFAAPAGMAPSSMAPMQSSMPMQQLPGPPALPAHGF